MKLLLRLRLDAIRHRAILSKVKVILLFFMILVIFYSCMTWNSKLLNKVLKNDGGIAIVAATIGSITGGIISYFTNYIANIKNNKMKNAIFNKRTIYEPLLLEVNKISKYIANNQNVPDIINIGFKEIDDGCFTDYLVINTWKRIKDDTRFYKMPEYLKEQMENLHFEIKELERYKRYIEEDVFDKACDELESFGYRLNLNNRYSIFQYYRILENEIDEVDCFCNWEEFEGDKSKYEIDVIKIKENIFKHINRQQYINNYTSIIQKIEDVNNNCKKILEVIVKDIIRQYEIERKYW